VPRSVDQIDKQAHSRILWTTRETRPDDNTTQGRNSVPELLETN